MTIIDEDINHVVKGVAVADNSSSADIEGTSIIDFGNERSRKKSKEREDMIRHELKKTQNEVEHRSRGVGVFKMGSIAGSPQVVHETVNIERAIISGSICNTNTDDSLVATLVHDVPTVDYVDAIEAVPVDESDLLMKQLTKEKKRNRDLIRIIVIVICLVGASIVTALLLSSTNSSSEEDSSQMKSNDANNNNNNACEYNHAILCKDDSSADGWCRTTFCECDDNGFDREIPIVCQEGIVYPCGEDFTFTEDSSSMSSDSSDDKLPQCIVRYNGLPIYDDNTYCETFLKVSSCPY